MIGWHQTKPTIPNARWSLKLHWVVGQRTLCGAGRPHGIQGRNTTAEAGMPKCQTCQKKRAAEAQRLADDSSRGGQIPEVSQEIGDNNQ